MVHLPHTAQLLSECLPDRHKLLHESTFMHVHQQGGDCVLSQTNLCLRRGLPKNRIFTDCGGQPEFHEICAFTRRSFSLMLHWLCRSCGLHVGMHNYLSL